jgi:hypothetical protein
MNLFSIFFRRLKGSVGLVVVLVFSALALPGTTVIPPEFDSLVRQADYVIRGTVKSVSSEWRTRGADRFIVTHVEIHLLETVAGTPPSPIVLEMLGGRVGEETMVVQGSPNFRVGDEHILFIRGNGIQFNPLVALMHGQYPVKKDAASGRAYVTRSDGSLLRDEKDVVQPIHLNSASPNRAATAETPVPTESALSPADFSTRIRASRQKSATP